MRSIPRSRFTGMIRSLVMVACGVAMALASPGCADREAEQAKQVPAKLKLMREKGQAAQQRPGPAAAEASR